MIIIFLRSLFLIGIECRYYFLYVYFVCKLINECIQNSDDFLIKCLLLFISNKNFDNSCVSL